MLRNVLLIFAGLCVGIVGSLAFLAWRDSGDDRAVMVRFKNVTITQVEAGAQAFVGGRAGYPADRVDEQSLLRDTLTTAILADAATAAGVSISEDQVRSTAAAAYASAQADENAVAAAYRTSPKALQMAMRNKLLVDAWREEVSKGDTPLKPTEKQIQDAYEQTKVLYRVPEARKAEIVVTESEAQARDIIARVRKGASLTQIAKTESVDPSRLTGGVALIARNSPNTTISAAVFGRPAGSLIGPLKATTGGWAVVRPLGPVLAPRTRPLEEVRSQVEQSLASQRTGESWQKTQDSALAAASPEIDFGKGWFAFAGTPTP